MTQPGTPVSGNSLQPFPRRSTINEVPGAVFNASSEGWRLWIIGLPKLQHTPDRMLRCIGDRLKQILRPARFGLSVFSTTQRLNGWTGAVHIQHRKANVVFLAVMAGFCSGRTMRLGMRRAL